MMGEEKKEEHVVDLWWEWMDWETIPTRINVATD